MKKSKSKHSRDLKIIIVGDSGTGKTSFVNRYILNKFAGAGIPGGSVMVSLPILEHVFGFNAEMLALMTTFYMLLDPVATATNVTANNFFVLFIQKAWRSMGR